MERLRELLAIDQRQALEFFFMGLRDVSEPSVEHAELLYNASVLAHYAQVSTGSGSEMPTPATLAEVFDHFVLDTTLHRDGAMMEVAAAQCLLLGGFFEDQLRDRHSIPWYSKLGAGFFGRAAKAEQSIRKARLLDTLSRGFEAWRQRYARLGRELRSQPFLLGHN